MNFGNLILQRWQSKWVVAGLFGSVLLLRHDGAALWAIIGSVSNSALSAALKRILNQERPVATLRSDPGMPSIEAQTKAQVYDPLEAFAIHVTRVSRFLYMLLCALMNVTLMLIEAASIKYLYMKSIHILNS